MQRGEVDSLAHLLYQLLQRNLPFSIRRGFAPLVAIARCHYATGDEAAGASGAHHVPPKARHWRARGSSGDAHLGRSRAIYSETPRAEMPARSVLDQLALEDWAQHEGSPGRRLTVRAIVDPEGSGAKVTYPTLPTSCGDE